MDKEQEQTLAQKLRNEARIRELEQIIPRQMVIVTRLVDTHEYARHEIYLSEMLIEYRERTGRQYVAPKIDLLYRKHGGGA